MTRSLNLMCATLVLAFAACAHDPEGDDADAGGSCTDVNCLADGGQPDADMPDDGGNPDGGCANCQNDGGMTTDSGGMVDGGSGGNDGGSCTGEDCSTDGGAGGGSDGGSCGVCPEGQTCVDSACVCDGDGDDGSDGACRAGKTLLCHYPPGNPDNDHDICVGNHAVPAHLDHGDALGACP